MKIKFLDGEKLYYAFLSGKREVLKRRKHLNKINVFPVPDGDTGTNLALTMESIFDGTRANSHISEMSKGMAEAAIMGSRGNSGIIFAQFIHGLSEAVKGKKALSRKEFSQAMRRGVEYAYNALGKPVEGTILTVMRAWVNSLHGFHDKASDFVDLMHHSLGAAREALKDTPKMLKVLQKAGVVDAGAQGFVLFLEGIARFLRHGKKLDPGADTVGIIGEDEDLKATGGQLQYRYCAEALVKGDTIDKEAIRSCVSKYGDSAIVAGDAPMAKIHIHTNTPQDVFYNLRHFGTFVHQKVDDMKRQYEIQYDRKASIALVTDSTCDLPPPILDAYQIHVVPVNIHFGDSHFLDRVALTPTQFYDMLKDAEEYPTTSQPAVKAFEDMYSHLAKHYDAIISIHIAEALSGTSNAARLAASRFEGYPITVIDSKLLSSALGLMIICVAEEIAMGTDYDDIVRLAASLPPRIGILVSVKTLQYLVRGGRVSPLKGIFAKALNLKPIISLDENGATTFHGKAFSEKGCVKKILKMINAIHREKPIRMFAIGHAHTNEEAKKLQDKVEVILGQKALLNVDIAPVIGVHAGIGALSVAYLTE